MLDLLKFDFCDMHIYDNYLIVIMKEGIIIKPAHNQVLVNVVETYYNYKRFVYISNRLHSYSVDPAVYFETSKIENLAGFAVVSKDFKAKSNAEIEKLFLDKPFEIFSTIDDAVNWGISLLNK